MGTTTSTTDDPYRTAPSSANWFGGAPVGASPLAGRLNAPAPPGLPPQLAPGYRPPLPAQITPNAPWTAGSPATADYNNRLPAAPAASGQQYDPITLQPLGLNDPRRVGGPFMGITQSGVITPPNVDPGMVRRPDQMPQGDGSYAGQILGHEGVGKNPRSSASGYGGFIDSTWQAFAQANPQLFQGMSPEQIMMARNNPQIARMAIDWYARQNAGFLAQRGIPATGQALGIAHYLGPAGAARVMQASDETPVRSLVDPAAVAANPELGYMTVGQLKARYANMANPASPDGTASSYTPQQAFLPAEPREFHSWGQPAEGQARHQDLGTIMGRFAPLLLGIASLGLRLPLSTAITAYSAMARAQYNGQEEAYQRARTQWQDAYKESTARQAMESQDYGDAFAQYGQNNPQGLQQELARLALRYNDPAMLQMAERGDLQGAYRMQQQRDLHNQSLQQGGKLIQEQQDQQEVERTVAADMAQWDQAHLNATPQERQIAEFETRTKRQNEMAGKTGKGTEAADAPTGQIYDVLGQDGKPTGQQVRAGKNQAEWLDPNSGARVQLKPGERVQQTPRAGAGAESLEVSKPYDIVDDKGHVVKPNVMLREARNKAGYVHSETGEPLQLEPGQSVKQITPTTSGGGRAGAQVLRQLVGGREVLSDLQNVVRLPIGTTLGPLGTAHPGPTITGALTGDLARKLTDQDSQLMQASMASMERELSVLMSPVYGGNWAAQQISPLIPKTGDTLGTVLFKLSRLAQSADNALEAASKSPILSGEEQEYAAEMRKQINEAIPWSTAEAMDFAYRGQQHESFGDYVKRQGISGGGGTTTDQGGTQVPAMTEEQYNTAPSGTRYRMPNDPPGTVRVKP